MGATTCLQRSTGGFLRRANGYDEQDIEAALCAYFVPFPGANPTDVQVVLETQFPEIYAGIIS